MAVATRSFNCSVSLWHVGLWQLPRKGKAFHAYFCSLKLRVYCWTFCMLHPIATGLLYTQCTAYYMTCTWLSHRNCSKSWTFSLPPQPECSQLSVLCAGCSTSNSWHSRHCYHCGGLIKAPLRYTSSHTRLSPFPLVMIIGCSLVSQTRCWAFFYDEGDNAWL